ncbi:MAG: aminoglycoside phosphotransferase family protein [Defluviitaleaceae bacterium]|nr:aminoglycoside phosphotransferase family protein [Defluviitaleaceae bacterium]MCL2273688.1 aminoglycoside phosphotransferase family protein [Defluviitaleaceae bacterium]
MTEKNVRFLKENFIAYRPISGGMSPDEKYYAHGRDCRPVFIRFANACRANRLTKEFEMLKQLQGNSIPTPCPVALGSLNGGKYMITQWINGDVFSEVLPRLDAMAQYTLGHVAGEMLQNIHAMPVNGSINEWKQCPYEKMKASIKAYPQYVARFTNAEKKLVDYIESNKHWLQSTPIAFLHGDYTPRNMMLAGEALLVVDFNSFLFSVTWADIGKVVSKAKGEYPFYKGLLNRYFDGEPAKDAVQRIIFYAALHRIDHFFNNILFNRVMLSNDDFFDNIAKMIK